MFKKIRVEGSSAVAKKNHDHQMTEVKDLRSATSKKDNTTTKDAAQKYKANKRREKDSQTKQTETATNIIRRIFSLLNMFTWTHFGMCSNFGKLYIIKLFSFILVFCNNQGNYQQSKVSSRRTTFERNVLKRTTDYGRHWGDLRATFELSVNAILDLYREKNFNDSDYTSDNEETFNNDKVIKSVGRINRGHHACAYEQMITLVRKDLASSLRNLIQHGLIGCYQQESYDVYQPSNFSLCPTSHVGGASRNQALASAGAMSSLLSIGLGCFSNQNASTLIKKSPSHAWELLLYYYDLKVSFII